MITEYFTLILYCEEESFFCNEIAQEIYTALLKQKISLHCVEVNVCVTLPKKSFLPFVP